VIWTTRISRLRHESVQHLFWECDHVRDVVNEVGCRIIGLAGCVSIKNVSLVGWMT